MFWKKKKIDKIDSTEGDELSELKIGICQSPYANIDIRRDVLDWRDKHNINVELHLAREITSLCNALDEQTEKMSYRDLFSQKKFGKEYLEPIYKDWVEREVTHVINAAQKDLSALFAQALEYCEHSIALRNEENKGHHADVAIAAVATVAGLAAIPAVTAFSVASAGGIAGFLGFTAISWPVVVVGAAAVGVLLLLGGYKAASVKSRALTRYRKVVRNAIKKQVLGSDGDNDSIRQRLQSYISNTAENIIMEIDNGNTF